MMTKGVLGKFKNALLVVTLGITLAAGITFATTIWQGTTWISDGEVISAGSLKANLDYLYEQVEELSGFSGISSYTSPGNYTYVVADGVSKIKVEVAGAGGGGGTAGATGTTGGDSSFSGNGENIVGTGGAGGIGSFDDTTSSDKRHGKAHVSGTGGDFHIEGKGGAGGMGGTKEYQSRQYDIMFDGHSGNNGGLAVSVIDVTEGQSFSVSVGAGGAGAQEAQYYGGGDGGDGYVIITNF